MLEREGLEETGAEGVYAQSKDGARIYVNATRMAKYKTLGTGGHEILHHVFWKTLMRTSKWQIIDKNGELQEFSPKQMEELKKMTPKKYNEIIEKGERVDVVSARGRKLIEHLMKSLKKEELDLVNEKIESTYKYEVE